MKYLKFFILATFWSQLAHADAGVYSNYRKDYFYPFKEYQELNLPDPVDGGRFHIISTAEGNGTFNTMILNGKHVKDEDPDKWYVDWLHVYPMAMQAGEPIWISFHTRDTSFNKEPNQMPIELQTSSGTSLFKGNFLVQLTSCNISYITVTSDYATLLVHVHNGYTDASRTIKTVLVNSTDMTTKVTNQASLSIPPQSSTLLSIPLPQRQYPGNLVTVALIFAESGSVPIGNGVRLAKTHFPIESWPKSFECPFPTVKDDNYQFHRSHGIDTLFFGQHASSKCGKDVPGTDIAGKLAPQYSFYCLIQTDISLNSLQDSSNVLGKLLGDEIDSHLDDQLRDLMTQTDSLWKDEQPIMTYVGGSRSRMSGIISGIADIQGMDMYIAACAPHVQIFTDVPPLRGSYDYLRLTRNNHMPLTTWLYSQLFDDAWDAQFEGHTISHRQPKPDEARIQAMSVIAGCAKGLMYFQSEIKEKEYYGDTWDEIGKFNKDIGAVREYLREGDCTDMVKSSDGSDYHANSIAQAIRSPEAIIVPVINLKNDGGMSSVECELGKDEHWNIKDHTVSAITVNIPNDFGQVVDKFEVLNGKITNITGAEYKPQVLGTDAYGNSLVGGSLTIANVALSSKVSTRLFVLANTADVRTNVQKNLIV
jgi:desulfoferrodoxin (superoxide reductase-like protein)